MEVLDTFKIKDDVEVIIRFADKKDLDTIIEIESICFPKAEAASEKSFRERFEVFPENFLVAEIKNNRLVKIIKAYHSILPRHDKIYLLLDFYIQIFHSNALNNLCK